MDRVKCSMIGQFLRTRKMWSFRKFSILLRVKVSKSIIFIVKPFLGNFYRHLAIFIWSHWLTRLIQTTDLLKINRYLNHDLFLYNKGVTEGYAWS